MKKTIAALAVVVSAALSLVACTGETAKDATAAVVGKGIEVGKGTVTGIAAGVEQGRKNAESADGALVVSTDAELKTHGGAKVGAVEADGAGSRVDILVENTTDKPLRATKPEDIVLDKHNFLACLGAFLVNHQGRHRS